MTITFANDNDVIVYALEKIISYARKYQYIFLAQSVRWISSMIGLQSDLIPHIDNLNLRSNVGIDASQSIPSVSEGLDKIPTNIHQSRIAQILSSDRDFSNSNEGLISIPETDIHDEVIQNCKVFFNQSKQERKAIGRKNREASRVIKRQAERPIITFGIQTRGIVGSELRRRTAANECQRCAWSPGIKGSHKALDCHRAIRLEKGTALVKKNIYNKD
jgi:hypothetical protein